MVPVSDHKKLGREIFQRKAPKKKKKGKVRGVNDENRSGKKSAAFAKDVGGRRPLRNLGKHVGGSGLGSCCVRGVSKKTKRIKGEGEFTINIGGRGRGGRSQLKNRSIPRSGV